jgi:hypothetical protein
MKRALSGIIKEMACAVLAQPETEPSSEAAHAALLFAHVAWNRTVALGVPDFDYRPVLSQFVASNPRLWKELRSTDPEALISELMEYKRTHYRNDLRHVLVCGMLGANVHVEWVDPSTN